MKYIFFLLFIFSNSAFGCSCASSSIKDSFTRADVVFLGKVVEVNYSLYDSDSNPVIAYTFEIIRDYKRNISTSEKSYITTYSPIRSIGGGCASIFNKNNKYLVFGGITEIGFSTDICSNTMHLDEFDDIQKDSIEVLSKNYFKTNDVPEISEYKISEDLINFYKASEKDFSINNLSSIQVSTLILVSVSITLLCVFAFMFLRTLK